MDESGKSIRNIALPPEDRHFLQRVVTIVYSNPFADAPPSIRDLIDSDVIGGVSKGRNGSDSPDSIHYFNHLFPILSERLKRLSAVGISSVKEVAEEDSRLLKSAYLFELFHQYVDAFDDLIDRQQVQGDKPVAAPFAPKILKCFKERGFNSKESYRYLAFFYQLRRAYRFIRDGLTGNSASMRQLRFTLWNNVFTADTELFMHDLWDQMEDFSTLLLGATGTGKGAAAAAIGRSGHIPYDMQSGTFKSSFTTTFSAINLSQFPENLIESELFGHRKGAFTGAIDKHSGVFERCLTLGTLFLDEIGDVSTPIQIKLLNVLQERLFTPVGSHEIKRFSGRVIAATNHSLDEMRRTGLFREDFYYRLSSDVIHMPSLQQRIEEYPGELELLVTDLVEKMLGGGHSHAVSRVVDRVMDALQPHVAANYSWPGNVRELSQAIRRVLLSGDYRVVVEKDSSAHQAERLPAWLRQAASGELTNDELLTNYYKMLYEQLGGSYQAVAERVGVNWRTVKKLLGD